MDNGLTGLMGLAKRAGKAELGEEPAAAAALSHKARVLLVAKDAADNTRQCQNPRIVRDDNVGRR